MISIKSFLSVVTACVVLTACGGSREADTLTSPEQARAQVTVNRLGSGEVKSSPYGIDCGQQCDTSVTVGTALTLSARAASGYKFTGWSGSQVDCAGTGTCTLTVEDTKSLTATFSPVAAETFAWNLGITGSGTVTTDRGDTCSDDCSAQVPSGTQVTFTAAAAQGYSFSGWSGSGISCGDTTTCQVTIDAARSLTATFTANPLPTFALNVTISGSGTVGSSPAGINCSSSCNASYTQGTSVTLAATPAKGYSFSGWSNGCTGTGACTVTMSAARNVTATFTATPVNTAALNAVITGSGTVVSTPAGINCPTDCSETLAEGTSVSLTATPSTGYKFTGWATGGPCSGTGTCTLTLASATSVGAIFDPITYALSVTKQGSGTVASTTTGISCGSTCSATYSAGTSVTLKATAASGYTFTNWTGACTGTGNCTVAMNAATSVTAVFTAIPTYVLTVTKQGSGTVTSNSGGISCGTACSGSYSSGTSVILTAAAASGYNFSGWSGACTGTATTCTVAVNAASSVTATFTAAPVTSYLLTVTTQGSGTVAASSGGISCGTTCSASYAQGTSVTLTATPSSGNTFTGWAGACSGTATTCSVTINAASSVSAAFATSGTPGQAATYYVDVNAANDNGTGTAASPKKYISSAVALMSANGGDTVIVKPGTYSNAKDAIGGSKSGKAGAWNTIKAEVDGTVIITVALTIPLGDHYLQYEGLSWESNAEKNVTGRYVKFLRCAFKGGPLADNTMNLAIGTNDVTPGAQYILVEDSYIYGPGGRYNLLVYNSDKVVLRRVTARHQSGWKDTKGDPQGTISLYNSTDVLTQNLLIVDSGDPTGYFEAALYHPSNSRASSNIQNVGAMILNTAGTAVGWDDHSASTGNLLQDSVIWGADSAVSINGAAHTGSIIRTSIGKVTGSGLNDWSGGGKFSVTNSVLLEVANNKFSSLPHSNNVCYAPTCSGESSINPALSGMLWVTQTGLNSVLSTLGLSNSRVGATVIKRLGVSGTLWGEAGYNQATTENLWPWPREAQIKKSMCTDSSVTTGFCAKPSLTQYVWELMGNAMPSSFVEQ